MEELKHLVRIAKTDLLGKKTTGFALKKIKGVGYPFAHAVCIVSNVDKHKKVGRLSKEEIERLEEVVNNPAKYNIPEWMYNRRRDPETNEAKHLITTKLVFRVDQDLIALKKLKNYRGVRHAKGLTVRGQRTRSNFRKNKGKSKLGVQRKKK